MVRQQKIANRPFQKAAATDTTNGSLEGPASMARRYGATETFDGYTATQFRRMKKADRVEAMVEWFHAHFEDPAERTPYESAEGGYIWIWGGPHEATEEIEAEFGEVVDFELIGKAAEKVQTDGLFDWAPRPKPGDYDERPPEDEADEDLDIAPTPSVPEPEARADVLQRIEALEQLGSVDIHREAMMAAARCQLAA